MTTPTRESVKALADGLTDAQLTAMEWASTTWLNPVFNSSAWFWLSRKGVLERRFRGYDGRVEYRLTSLGLALSAHLGASHA